MSVINTQPLAGASGQATGYNLERSLRFRSSASAYLNRTLSSSDRQKWTWSGWVKRGTFSGTQSIFSCYGGTTNSVEELRFFSNGTLEIGFFNVSSWSYQLVTTQVFRDPSAWYHISIAVDTTQATAANRVKMYVNGTQVTSFSTATYPSQNTNTLLNGNFTNYIGAQFNGSLGQYFDGYLTEINFIGGQQLDQSSFGENDTITGVWKPKSFVGTYGTNGFYLPFTNTASTSTLGNDFSGNSNTWTVNNISLTAGATYDSMTDVPTLTSATAANYCVLNPLDKNSGITSANGNLSISGGGGWILNRATIGMTSGKWYWECTLASGTNGNIGICPATSSLSSQVGAASNGYAYNATNGQKFNNDTGTSYGATWTTNDVIGIAFDSSAGTLTFYKNGTSQGTAFSSIPSNTYFPAFAIADNGYAVNFGQRPFAYTPPTGFVALNTFNLPDSTIKAGNKYMDISTWTGNGTNPRAISGLNFQPDFVWLKARSLAGQGNQIVDAVRGYGTSSMNTLITNQTVAEESNETNTGQNVAYGNIQSLDSSGFTVDSGVVSADQTNKLNETYVAWSWDANGAGSSNTSGTITSTVSVNASAGFSVSTYSGTGANATVGHGLGVAPRFVIVKNRTLTDDWCVYHKDAGAANYSQLNLTSAFGANSTIWNNTDPTSSVFSVGTYLSKSGSNYVAYCWSEIEGFSRFGSYTGNGSTDGPFVYLGFRPKYIMFKNISVTGAWEVYDTSRNAFNTTDNYLLPNSSGAEGVASGRFDYVSNGVKVRNTGGSINGSGNTIIYMAFAENPFKNSLAR